MSEKVNMLKIRKILFYILTASLILFLFFFIFLLVEIGGMGIIVVTYIFLGFVICEFIIYIIIDLIIIMRKKKIKSNNALEE